MTIYDLKPRFQALLRPLSDRLCSHGVRPNAVTLTALILSVGTGVGLLLLGAGRPWLFGILAPVLLLRMALNALDGMMAREHGMTSASGALLNEVGDVVSDAALLLPLAVMLPGGSLLLLTMVIALTVISEVAGLAPVLIGAGRNYAGPMGKSDRTFVLGALGLGLSLIHI